MDMYKKKKDFPLLLFGYRNNANIIYYYIIGRNHIQQHGANELTPCCCM